MPTPPKRRPGRPPLDPHAESISVHLRMPTKAYGNLVQRAQREQVTVAAFVRRCLPTVAE